MKNTTHSYGKVLASILLVWTFLMPEAAVSGSLYSSNYVGLWSYFTSGQSAGMGGVSIAAIDHLTINQLNPAARYPFYLSRISGTFVYDKDVTKAPAGSGSNEQSLTAGFSFLVPIGRRVSFSSNLRQMSSVNFRANEAGSIDGNEYEREVKGEGGLNKLDVSLFYTPWSRLYLGVATNFYFGQIKEVWKIDFASSWFKDTNNRYSTSVKGFNTTLGIVIRPAAGWNFGSFVSPQVVLSGKTEITYTYGRIDTINDVKRTIPLRWGVGTTYQPKEWIMIGADYKRQEWGAIDNLPSTLWDFNDSGCYAFGLEVTPAKGASVRFFRRASYRLGFRYHNLYFTDPEKDLINEYVITFGVGLPFNADQGRIDFALEFGRRGNLEANPFEESIIRVMLGVTGGERWFVRRP